MTRRRGARLGIALVGVLAVVVFAALAAGRTPDDEAPGAPTAERELRRALDAVVAAGAASATAEITSGDRRLRAWPGSASAA